MWTLDALMPRTVDGLSHLRLDGDLHRAAIGVRDWAAALGLLRDVGKLRRLEPLQPVRRHLELRRHDLDARVAFVGGHGRANPRAIRRRLLASKRSVERHGETGR